MNISSFKKNLSKDFPASIVVFLVALPLPAGKAGGNAKEDPLDEPLPAFLFACRKGSRTVSTRWHH